MKPTNQPSLPGLRPEPKIKKNRWTGEITVIYPVDAEIATMAGRWRRLESGEIEAQYTKEEFELCQLVMGEI